MVKNIILISTVIGFIVILMAELIQLLIKIKKRMTFYKELIFLTYLIIIIIIVQSYINIGLNILDGANTGIGYVIVRGVYFGLALSILAKIIWSIVGLFSKEGRKWVKIFFLGGFMILSICYLLIEKHLLFYSPQYLTAIFYDNMELFEEFKDYIKSEDFQGSKGGDNYYSVIEGELWVYSNGIYRKGESVKLKELYLPIILKCHVSELSIYNNRDIRLSVTDKFAFQYTDDEKVKKIFQETIAIYELDKGWYAEYRNEKFMNRDSGFIDNYEIIFYR